MNYIWEGMLNAFFLLCSGDYYTLSAIATTLHSTGLALCGALLLGVPTGFCLGYYSFPGKRFIRMIFDTLLAFPTVLIGLLVYSFLTRRGPLGELDLLFTVVGMAIGQCVLALPILVSMLAQAVESLDPRCAQTLKTLGANRIQIAVGCFFEVRHEVLLALVTAFGRVVTEVGIAMMLGGNIKWDTRTMTTAIALETGKGEFSQGIALGLVLLLIALGVNALLLLLRRR